MPNYNHSISFSRSWFAILIQIKIPISCPRAKYAITYIYQFQHSVKKIMVSGRRETPNPSEDKCFSLQNVTIGWVQRAWNLQKFCSTVNRYSIQWGICSSGNKPPITNIQTYSKCSCHHNSRKWRCANCITYDVCIKVINVII